MTIEARWYQQEAVEAVFDYYSQPRKLDANGKPERKNALICLPTGTGKSLVIGQLAERMFREHPDTRLIMQTHVKELIKQNASKLLEVWPNAPLGIYSAGLKSAQHVQPIVFGGIQSCVGKYPKFGHRDFLLIDEAHLVGSEGSYLKFINELQMTNPYLKIIGLSATPYRLGLGCLTNGEIFTDIIFDLCNMQGFNRLIAEGYLCPLIGKRGQLQIDLAGVSLDSTGDYVKKEVSAAIKRQHKTQDQLAEFVSYGSNRRSWVVFAAGIEEAEEIGDLLNNQFNIPTLVMHSKLHSTHNDAALKAWKAGEIRCIVNMNMLTTGVDNPMLDYMGDFAPTTSTGKHVQKNGRLTRPFPGKANGLVMDFAGNIRRLGPINDPVIPKKKGQGSPGDAPVRVCTEGPPRNGCGMYNHASATECSFCGMPFTMQDKTTRSAWEGDVLRGADELPEIANFKVDRCLYTPHVSKAMREANPNKAINELPFSIKVSYFCGLKCFYEWVTVEGKGGNIRGRSWFRRRFPDEPPATNAEVLAMAAHLKAPSSIDVWINCTPNPRVTNAHF